MIKNSKNILNEKILLYFGISTFIYALCIGLIIQFFILETLFNISGGLVVLDSVSFDAIAKEIGYLGSFGEIASEIKDLGTFGDAKPD